MNGVWWWWWKQWWKSNSTFCSFEGINTFLALLKHWGEWDALYFLFLSSQVGIAPLILLSDTYPFLPLVSPFLFFWGTRHLALFISSYPFLFSLSFFRTLISWNNIARGSNQDNSSIYFTGETEIGECFWLFPPGLGVEYFWVVLEMEMGGYMWMRTSGVEAACVSERGSESWFNHMTSS